MTHDPVDVLAFSPHPDDAELYCSGTLLELARAGRRTGIADLTRGELSTRGDEATRARETEAASRVLALSARVNLGIPDGGIENTPGNRLRVVRVIRALRPSIVLVPHPVDRHPDHGNAAALVREALFAAGLAKIRTEEGGVPQAPHRPAKAFHYMLAHDFEPAFIVDVSASQAKKEEAIRCYASQFWTGGEGRGDTKARDGSDAAAEPQTYVSSQAFMESLRGRARRLGFLIGVEYGEGLLPLQPAGLAAASLFDLLPR